MAEAIAIIGLASSIVTFIDFSLRIASDLQAIRLDGSSRDVQQLRLSLQDISNCNLEVTKQIKQGVKLSGKESLIQAMVTECVEMVDCLEKKLSKMVVRKDRLRVLEVPRVLLQNPRRLQDVDKIFSRLEGMEARIRRNAGGILESGTEDQQSAVSADLKRLRTAQTDMGTRLAQGTELDAKFRSYLNEYKSCSEQTIFLHSLYFTGLRRRWNLIPDADRLSNTWIYDTTRTTFTTWLESEKDGDSLYCINGRAGSGKSTLMKFVCDDPRTRKSLEKWAGSSTLYTASFFFWNQGFNKQKSQLGLLQSLLYELLKSSPDLLQKMPPIEPEHVEWEVSELKAIFASISTQSDWRACFCFFIDGLDEYEGDAEGLVDMLKFLSISKNIKLCASTRPRSSFERFFVDKSRTFDIAKFTNGDMRQYVRKELYKCGGSYQRLVQKDSSFFSLSDHIADKSNGVWLWVFLITLAITRAITSSEEIETVHSVVERFPANLEGFFKRMLEDIRSEYHEEMAQILLIAIDELQPLPLYAFSLLDREREDGDYALADFCPIRKEDLDTKYPAWISQLRNRCGDLLVVDEGEHPLFLSHSVDFLHRTVRDFLQDSYRPDLEKHIRSNFSPTISLCKMSLVMLKSLPNVDFHSTASVNKIIGLTDELLYYAHEAESRDPASTIPGLVEVLDEVDRVNTRRAQNTKGMYNHWTHARDSVTARGLDEYREGQDCNFLALTIQARLVKYVRAKLEADTRAIHKNGRPLLDYALRPRRTTPISMPYHSQRDKPSVDIAMVRLLLERGADPNRLVRLNDDRSVWALFLISMYESSLRRAKASRTLTQAWYQASELLIQHGVRQDCQLVKTQPNITVETLLEQVFGPERASNLIRMMQEKALERRNGSVFNWTPKWLSW